MLLDSELLIKIRPLKERDHPRIRDIIIRTISYSYKRMHSDELIQYFISQYTPEVFAQKAATIDYFVAQDFSSGKLLGIIGLGGNAVRTFYVDPIHQGKGIGRRLYNRIEREAIARGFEKLVLDGSPLGEPIWRKFGFIKKQTKFIEKDGIKYTTAYMEKSLEHV